MLRDLPLCSPFFISKLAGTGAAGCGFPGDVDLFVVLCHHVGLCKLQTLLLSGSEVPAEGVGREGEPRPRALGVSRTDAGRLVFNPLTSVLKAKEWIGLPYLFPRLEHRAELAKEEQKPDKKLRKQQRTTASRVAEALADIKSTMNEDTDDEDDTPQETAPVQSHEAKLDLFPAPVRGSL